MGGEWSVCCWEGEGDGSDSAGRKRVQPPSPPPPPLPEGVWKGATGARVVGRHGRKARATRHSLSPMQPENVVIDLITPPPSPRGGQVNRGSEGSIDATPVSSLITPGSTAAAGASAATEEAGAAPHQEGGLQLGEEGDDEVHEVEVTREARMDTGEAGAAPSFDDDDGCTITGERGFRANRDFAHSHENCGVPKSSKEDACPRCYCFVCDIPASSCTEWGEHHQATHADPKWRKMREDKKRTRRSDRRLRRASDGVLLPMMKLESVTQCHKAGVSRSQRR